MLNLQDLTKVYRTGGTQTTALDAVSLTIAQGEFVAVMGPSGCGKSTLLNILGLLDKPECGNYRFMDKDVSSLPAKQAGRLRKQHIGFIFQNYNLVDQLTVSENIELALLYRNINTAERKQRMLKVMDKLNITHRADHFPDQLSGGQQQRVAVARAVVGSQQLILADEPTGNLDSGNGQEVMEILQDLNSQGTTIVMVTHSEAHADYASRTINLFDGRVISQNLRAAV